MSYIIQILLSMIKINTNIFNFYLPRLWRTYSKYNTSFCNLSSTFSLKLRVAQKVILCSFLRLCLCIIIFYSRASRKNTVQFCITRGLSIGNRIQMTYYIRHTLFGIPSRFQWRIICKSFEICKKKKTVKSTIWLITLYLYNIRITRFKQTILVFYKTLT